MDKPFEILATEYRPMVVAYLRGLLQDEHLAEDIAQETFVAAHKSIAEFDTARNFGAWLRGIARNKALEDRRAASRRPVLVDSKVVEGMEEVYGLFDQQVGPWQSRVALIRQCVGRLSDNLQQVVLAVYGRGQSLKQAAEAVGASFAAVAKRLSRARDLVRTCVEQQQEQETKNEEKSHVRAQ